MCRSRRRRWLVGVMTLASAGVLCATGASAETVTRSGLLSITPGWTTATFDRNQLVLPFSLTAPCETTDFGSGMTSTYCDTVTVDLVHPSTPASVDSDYVMPQDSGTGAGSLTLYGFMLHGFGEQTLRATDTKTGEVVTTTVTLKALTRTAIAASRSKKAPAAGTLRVTATLTAFQGYDFSRLAGVWPVVLQHQVAGRWVTVKSARTSGGGATWSLKVGGKASPWPRPRVRG